MAYGLEIYIAFLFKTLQIQVIELIIIKDLKVSQFPGQNFLVPVCVHCPAGPEQGTNRIIGDLPI